MSNLSFVTPSTTVTKIDLAFPARGADPDFLPALDVIPSDFDSKAEWNEFHQRWFSAGLPATTRLYPRDGIDAEQAWNHLRVVRGCYGSKHEHKMAALAWLSSLWFTGYTL